jgi:hypothetical protein
MRRKIQAAEVNMVWVLLLFMQAGNIEGGVAIQSVTFHSQKACEEARDDAARVINVQWSSMMQERRLVAGFCIEDK